MRDLVEYLAKCLAHDPEAVRVEQQGSTYIIFVPKGSEGQLIGKGGRIIQAIRTIAKAAGTFGQRISIQIQAEGDESPAQAAELDPEPNSVE